MRHLVMVVASVVGMTASSWAQTSGECTDWKECRTQVETALADGSFERAHDLAWRTVQRGPRDDADLMFLLARAQCLSGRPEDALVMVRRLAERGVRTEALEHPDLERTRARPGWPEVEILVRRANDGAPPAAADVLGGASAGAAAAAGPAAANAAPSVPGATTTAASSASTPATVAPATGARASTALVERTATLDEQLRFAVDAFALGGVAYDGVSHRFVFGDRHGRKLRVVGEGLDAAVDLVRADSAGFYDVRALDIDTRRGDLWVASAETDGDAALHLVQLISGRPLRRLPLGAGARPVDLAVVPGGDVFVLGSGGEVWRARPGAESASRAFAVETPAAASLALTRAGAVVYVAHAAGIARVDAASGRAVALQAPEGVRLEGFERLRPHRDGLVGLQAGPDGTRKVVRLALSNDGRAVRSATVFDVDLGNGNVPPGFVVAGDDVLLVFGLEAGADVADARIKTAPVVPVVRRLRLQ